MINNFSASVEKKLFTTAAAIQSVAKKLTRRSRLSRQCLETSFVALCNQSLSAANRTTSIAANHFGAFGAGSPNGISLLAAIKT